MKKTGPTKISSPGLSLGQGQTKMTKKSGCCPEARDGRSQIALQMAQNLGWVLSIPAMLDAFQTYKSPKNGL